MTNGTTRAITRDALSDGQIVGLVREVAEPGGGGTSSAAGAPVTFGYHSPSGEVQVELTPGAEGSRAVVRPARAGRQRRPRARPDLAAARGEMEGLLRLLVEAGASDLHLRAGQPPMLRREGELVREPGDPIPAERLEPLLVSMMSPRDDRRVPRDGATPTGPTRSRDWRASAATPGGTATVRWRCSGSFRRRSGPRTRWASAARCRTSATSPRAWWWSPGRPDRARAPRWRRWSISSTGPGPTTSSPSRIRSSSCTRARSAW